MIRQAWARWTAWMAFVPLLLVPGNAIAADDDQPLVAIVFGQYSHWDSPQGEGASARTYMNTVREALDAVGVRYTVLSDLSVETDGLRPYQVAIFPYNFLITETEQDSIARYVAGGGKIMVFYSIPQRVAALLGLRALGRTEGRFQTLRLDQSRLYGLPESITQASWNILPVEIPSADTGIAVEVIGEWVGPDGQPTGQPGLLLSPNGAYMGHVLTEGDTANKGRMLLAVLGRLVPGIWQRASAGAIAAASGRVEELRRRMLEERVDPDSGSRADSQVGKAREKLAEAQRLAGEGRPAEAIEAAMQARREAELGYVLSAPERMDEFRAVWLHDAYGVPGWGWERSIRELGKAGFNAIIANMLWAGLAHYPSDYLPTSPRVQTEGDQIAEALRWCKQLGVELHVWKVNYNLLNAPDDFVAKLRAEGRLQRHRDGSEILWLCPSDPRNFALERDSMLEVVRNYDVAGIHFDYIRYPHGEACYCDGCRRRFEEAAGVMIQRWPDEVLEGPLAEPFRKWQQDQITGLVRAVATEARRIRPGIMVSAAVFSWPGAINWVGQNWPQWVEEGLLDFVCPMNYTPNVAELESMVVEEVKQVAGRIPLYIGIGEFVIPEDTDLVNQIERARRLGADGFVCFSYEHLGSTEGRMAGVHGSLTAHATSPPHPAPRARFAFPPGDEGRLGLAYQEGTPVEVQVTLATEGNYGRPVRSASGMVYVETTDGRAVHRLGGVSSARPLPLVETLELPPGGYRLIIRGSASFGSTRERTFVVRSRPFEITRRAAALP